MLRVTTIASILTALCTAALALSGDPIRIGILADMAGVYADDQGPGSVVGAQMAVEDYGGKAAGRRVEVVSADHQNKTDLGAAIARRWLENEGVSMIADLPNSAIALAVSEFVKQGGKVMGAARHPIGTSDFSSLLLQAQNSGAEAVAFANAGGDTSNSLKQAAEFGLGQRLKLAALIMGQNNVRALGLQASQGILLLVPFYWDMNDATRAFARRFQERHPKHLMPNDMQAGIYSGVLHYLKAVDKVGNATDGKAVVAAMKAMPTDDPLFGKGSIREDGRKLHPMYLFQVKSPAESKGPWDFYKLVSTIPADQAFRPLQDGGCPLVRK